MAPQTPGPSILQPLRAPATFAEPSGWIQVTVLWKAAELPPGGFASTLGHAAPGL